MVVGVVGLVVVSVVSVGMKLGDVIRLVVVVVTVFVIIVVRLGISRGSVVLVLCYWVIVVGVGHMELVDCFYDWLFLAVVAKWALSWSVLCSKVGHLGKDCGKVWRGGGGGVCYYCGLNGYMAVCSLCGVTGHLGKDCW
ncbi:protein RNA-directed DNA methylation 3 [Tanacetum coccineum]